MDFTQRFGSGKAVNRIEDLGLLQGRGIYTDDVRMEGLLHLVFLRSPYAHAKLGNIDTSAAKAMPGVVAVFSGADLVADGVKPLPTVANFVRPDGTPAISAPRMALAHGRVRHVGEAIAMVIATSRDAAKDAAEAIVVDVEDLPAVVDIQAALRADAPRLIEGAADNVSAQSRYGSKEASEAAFAKAAKVVRLNLKNQRIAPASIEPRSILAYPDPESNRLTVRMSTQMPTGVRDMVTNTVPQVAKGEVRVVVGDVGGGFGMKTGAYPEDVAVAYAAKKLGRPVKWIAERSEEFLTAVAGRDTETEASLALDANGKILALRVNTHANVGAYATGTGVAIQLLIGPWVTTSVYDIQTIDFTFTAVMTNTASTGAYRGAGRPEAIYLMERLMDQAARELAIDPAELRRRNLIAPAQTPYRNPMGQTYDSGQFEKMLDLVLAKNEWKNYGARHAASNAAGKLRGRGLVTFLEWTGGNALEEQVSVRVRGDGFVDVVSATMAMGQGLATTYTQLAVDVFGVAPEKIRILQGDTDRANGFGSAGSRSLFTGGTAVREGSRKVVEKAKALAADDLEVPEGDLEYQSGRFTVVGTDKGVDLFALAGKQPDAVIQFDGSTTAGGPSWPNGAHIVEVEIDPATGDVSLDTYVQFNDIGRVVNPTIVVGQLEGGVIQGLGQALCEQTIYDGESGQLVTGSLMDYTLPRADMLPRFSTHMDESSPCKTNLLGVKGVGELGTIGATPAVVNAIVDALIRAGVAQDKALALQMPFTSDKVWAALR